MRSTGYSQISSPLCVQMDAHLSRILSGTVETLPADLQHHAQTCSRCRTRAALFYPALFLPRLPVTLRQQVTATLNRDLKPVPPLSPPVSLAARFVALFLVLLVVGVRILGTAGLSRMVLPEMAAVSTGFLLSLAAVTYSLNWQITPGSRRLVPGSLLELVGLASLVAILVLPLPTTNLHQFVQDGLPCMFKGLAAASIGSVLFWIVLRRISPWLSESFAIALAAAAGVLALTLLQITCAVHAGLHLLVWHGGVALITLVAAFGLARLRVYL